MPEIDPLVMVHWLNIDSIIKPMKHERGSFAPKWNQVVTDEVDKQTSSKKCIIQFGLLMWFWLRNSMANGGCVRIS
jgi:hypothetical protein